MWAMMPILRIRSSACSVAGSVAISELFADLALPAVVRERFVRLSHAVSLLALASRLTAIVRGIEQLGRELLFHRLARARACRLDDPAHGQSHAAVTADLDGHLIGRTTDASTLDLDTRTDVLHRALEDLQSLFVAALLHQIERSVHDPLGHAMLAGALQHAHEA